MSSGPVSPDDRKSPSPGVHQSFTGDPKPLHKAHQLRVVGRDNHQSIFLRIYIGESGALGLFHVVSDPAMVTCVYIIYIYIHHISMIISHNGWLRFARYISLSPYITENYYNLYE